MNRTRTYVIAEAGVNHNGSLKLALALVDAAQEAGADAVKFQTFRAEGVVTPDTAKANYQKARSNRNESQFSMLKALELNESMHDRLVERCRERGIDFLSTPFDLPSLALLADKYRVPRLKAASGEITNAPLLLAMAQTGKPIIVSTGMCLLGEIEEALGVLAYGYLQEELRSGPPSVQAFRQAYMSREGQRLLQERVTLMHCTTEYPAPLEDVHLRTMDTLSSAFQLPVGYSDHTSGIAVPIAAAARGAAIIEKHFTLDRTLPGPDHAGSLEPIELAAMIRSIREVETALGSPVKLPAASEFANRDAVRKSVVAAERIRSGDPFTSRNITAKRAGRGMSPMNYYELLNRKSKRDYEPDDRIETQE